MPLGRTASRKAEPAPTVAFTQLSFSVKLKGGGTKQLLHGVTGHAPSSQLTAIMGPSGSGKTTLLDVMAGVAYGGRQAGHVTADGHSMQRWAARGGGAAYVMQDEVLPTWDTPREALTTAALLRLPAGMPREKKLRRVEALLETLELTACADVVIGDATRGVRGLSGGQRRRVTVGIELIKDQQLVFLDEPLTGLDSEMSEELARCLQFLVQQQHKTVIFSLHSPTRAVEDMLDHLLLLAGGRMLFCGSYEEGPRFFEGLGHNWLQRQGAAEFLLSVAKTPEAAASVAQEFEKLARSGSAEPKDDEEWALAAGKRLLSGPSSKRWDWDGDAKTVLRSMSLQSEHEASLAGRHANKPSATFLQQLRVLLARNLRWMRRDWLSWCIQIVAMIATGLLIGLIYLDIPTAPFAVALQTRFTLLWLACSLFVFFNSGQGITELHQDRRLLRREHATKLYGLLPWWLARICRTAFVTAVRSLAFTITSYWLVKLRATAAAYFTLSFIAVLTAFAADLMGSILAAIAPDAAASYALQGVAGVILIACNSFINPSLPGFLVWVEQSSFVSFAYTALVLNEFDGLTLAAPLGNGTVTLHGVPPAFHFTHASWGVWPCVGVLAAQVGAMIALAFGALLLVARLGKL